MFHKIKGSLLITAIFVIIIFSIILASITRIFIAENERHISSVYSSYANLLAYSGVEYASSLLFPIQKNINLQGERILWGPVLGSIYSEQKEDIDLYSDICNGSTKDVSSICTLSNNGCYLGGLTISAIDSSISNIDQKYIYKIKSTGICKVPFIENENTGSYLIKKQIVVLMSDIRIK